MAKREIIHTCEIIAGAPADFDHIRTSPKNCQTGYLTLEDARRIHRKTGRWPVNYGVGRGLVFVGYWQDRTGTYREVGLNLLAAGITDTEILRKAETRFGSLVMILRMSLEQESRLSEKYYNLVLDTVSKVSSKALTVREGALALCHAGLWGVPFAKEYLCSVVPGAE